MDVTDIRKKSDEELMDMALAGNTPNVVAKMELEQRSTRRLTEFAASTEKGGKRMEWATWIILAATVVQLAVMALGLWNRGAVAPSPRFFVDSNGNVFDGKTGQACIPVNNVQKQDLPFCIDLYKRY